MDKIIPVTLLIILLLVLGMYYPDIAIGISAIILLGSVIINYRTFTTILKGGAA